MIKGDKTKKLYINYNNEEKINGRKKSRNTFFFNYKG